MIDKIRKILIYSLFIAVILSIWQFLVVEFSIPSYLLPSPALIGSTILQRLDLLVSGFLITLAEAVVGLVGAIFLSWFFAVSFLYSKDLENTTLPILISLKAVPIIAIAPLIVIWAGNGFISKAIMSGLISFFPLVVGLSAGLRSAPKNHVELLKLLGGNKVQQLTKVRIPHALPHFFSGLKVASTLSVVGAIVAEFSGANAGIGHTILVASLRLDTPLLFAAIILTSAMGIMLYYFFEKIEHSVIYWSESHDSEPSLS